MAYKYDPISRKMVVVSDGVGEILIIDAAVIADITNAANWDAGGNYTGPTAGMRAGNSYYDDNNNLRYYFDGATLRRSTYNDIA